MIDFAALLGVSRKYTLHSHTEFCDGRAQMEAFAREAVAQGFTHYGFTPHSPVPIVSPCNMLRDNIGRYDSEFRRIRETYGDRVEFYRGMEIDYLGDHFGPSHECFASLDLDYSIGSVHFIPSQQGEPVDIDGRFENFRKKVEHNFNRDIRYVVETYFIQSIKMVEAGGFDIIGHFDKIGHNAGHWQEGIEDQPWYKGLLSHLIDAIISSGVTVEINTKALREHGRYFPNPVSWPKLIEAGVPIVVNSDAHVPALINAGRDEAFALLDKITRQTPAYAS